MKFSSTHLQCSDPLRSESFQGCLQIDQFLLKLHIISLHLGDQSSGLVSLGLQCRHLDLQKKPMTTAVQSSCSPPNFCFLQEHTVDAQRFLKVFHSLDRVCVCVLVCPYLDDAEPAFYLTLRVDGLLCVLAQTLHKPLCVCNGTGDTRQLGLSVLICVV